MLFPIFPAIQRFSSFSVPHLGGRSQQRHRYIPMVLLGVFVGIFHLGI